MTITPCSGLLKKKKLLIGQIDLILILFIFSNRKQMETVIKQAEENRNRSIGIANRVHEEYLPLKHEIDHMRREYLGLNPLPDLHEEEGSVISAEYVF